MCPIKFELINAHKVKHSLITKVHNGLTAQPLDGSEEDLVVLFLLLLIINA